MLARTSMEQYDVLGIKRMIDRDYGRKDAARILLERALDASAVQFEKTGTIWEFYDPYGGNPLELQRKPHRKENVPCRDYLGHNPLIAMARLWELTR
jgi:putative isomerase